MLRPIRPFTLGTQGKACDATALPAGDAERPDRPDDAHPLGFVGLLAVWERKLAVNQLPLG